MKYYEKTNSEIGLEDGKKKEITRFLKSNKNEERLINSGWEVSEFARQYFLKIKRGYELKAETVYREDTVFLDFYDWDMKKVFEFEREKKSKIKSLEKNYKDHYKDLKKDSEIKDLFKELDIIYILTEEDILFREKNSFYTEYTDISSSNIEGCFKDSKAAIKIYEEKKDTFNFNIYNHGDTIEGSNLHLFSYDKNGDIKTIRNLSCIDEYQRVEKLILNHNEEVEAIKKKILYIGEIKDVKFAFIGFEEFGKREVVVQKSKNESYDYIAYIDVSNSTEFLIKVDENNNITDVTIDRNVDALQDYFYNGEIDVISLEENELEI